MFRSRPRLALLVALLCGAAFARDAKPPKSKWIRVSSARFAVLTDGGEKSGKEVVLRLEQMRAAFGELLLRPKVMTPKPIDVIAFATREEYAQALPSVGGTPISASAFFLPGEDRSYIVLDLSDEHAWQAVSRQVALLYLGYNYPPTQPWFDEGLAGYFSSIRLSDTQQQIGGDPASFVPTLNAQPWLPLPELFGEHKKSAIFQAESWIVMHYLLSQKKLPETGAYFGLVKNQNVPIAQAIQGAYGLSPEQMQESIKTYFHSIAPALQAGVAPSGAANDSGPIHVSLPPLAPDEVGTSYVEVSLAEAQALIAEMAARIPERRLQTAKELDALVERPEMETAIAHRALAWIYLQGHRYPDALEELGKALELDKNDPWVHYYLALTRFEASHAAGGVPEGLANTMQDLRIVIDLDPAFAEAYHMLGMAQLEGGGMHAAADAMRMAIQLNPRNQTYVLNMAEIDLAAKKWDDAAALLDRLKDSDDPKVAAAAQSDLADMPTLRKYGILPQRQSAATPRPAAPTGKPVYSVGSDPNDDSDDAPPPPEAGPDRRKVQFAKGRLVSVDCSQPPAATLKVAVGAQVLKMKTEDYKSLLLVGADEFSCDWKSVAVIINYKANAKGGGDLVSLEIH